MGGGLLGSYSVRVPLLVDPDAAQRDNMPRVVPSPWLRRERVGLQGVGARPVGRYAAG